MPYPFCFAFAIIEKHLYRLFSGRVCHDPVWMDGDSLDDSVLLMTQSKAQTFKVYGGWVRVVISSCYVVVVYCNDTNDTRGTKPGYLLPLANISKEVFSESSSLLLSTAYYLCRRFETNKA